MYEIILYSDIRHNRKNIIRAGSTNRIKYKVFKTFALKLAFYYVMKFFTRRGTRYTPPPIHTRGKWFIVAIT